MNRISQKTKGIIGAIGGASIATCGVIVVMDHFVFEQSPFERGITDWSLIFLGFLFPFFVSAISLSSKDDNPSSK